MCCRVAPCRQEPLKPAVVKERPHLEADPRYRRLDDSAELAATARLQFAQGLAAGEAQMQLARQALLIAAEDDAIGELGLGVVCCDREGIGTACG
jgi:hypothetical protein